MNSSLYARRARRFAVAAVVALGMAAGLIGSAHLHGNSVAAQEKAAAKPDPTAIVIDLDDLERLRALVPLKLQPGQVDKLIAALNARAARRYLYSQPSLQAWRLICGRDTSFDTIMSSFCRQWRCWLAQPLRM